MALSPDRVLRFGVFEANLAAHELRKHGVRLRLGGQPFAVLAMLLEKPGQVVTRDELRNQLWPSDTFVDFEQGLNGAVMKLRTALGDSPQNSRYIETLPRVGYRFIAPVTREEPLTPAPPVAEAPLPPAASPSPGNIGQTVRDPATQSRSAWTRVGLSMVVAFVAFVILAGVFRRYRAHSFALGPKDTVILADFQNTTGESVFDDALRESLTVSLQQSTLIQVVPERKTMTLLKQMGHTPDDKITGSIALELCQRSASKVAIQGSISSLGTGYLVGLAGIRCDTGEPILHEQVAAKSKDEVISALGAATEQLRKGLGESLSSIQKNDIPLTQATTSSLDALKAYTQALSIWDSQGDKASVPVFRKAIELDPQFAMAYAALATEYYNLGDAALARQNVTKAYELRDRLTERERFSIEARFHNYVTGNKEKAIQLNLNWLANHPDSPGSLTNLAGLYGSMGQHEKAAQSSRASLQVDPQRANTYANLVFSLLALGQLDQADAVLAEADKRNMQTDYLVLMHYRLAFLRSDPARMQEFARLSEKVSGAHVMLLRDEAATQAYFGRLSDSRQLFSQVVAESLRDADVSTPDSEYAEQAAIEAELGNTPRSAELLLKIKQNTASLDVLSVVAQVLAKTGHLVEAEALCNRLGKENPENTLLQGYWLPTIRAQAELQRGDWQASVRTLSTMGALEDGGSGQTIPVVTLYPAYVRASAYLAGGDGAKAATEFQKLIDHPGMVLNFPLGALARLGRARAFRLAQDPARARTDYAEFLALWKDADPDIPLLRHAKAEYAQLP